MHIDPERLRGALWGMFVGDALAMPAHWYYDVFALQNDYGEIRDYVAPRDQHPNAIMSRSSTGRAGRGDQQGEVIGSVILKGKKELWSRPNLHYHYGLQAGDNTLNLLCLRVLLRSMNRLGYYDGQAFLKDYVSFLTAPDSHNDTYAESYHRAFFANYAQGMPPEACAGREGHDTASIGGLVTLPPVIFSSLRERDAHPDHELILTHLRWTHRSEKLERFAIALADLMTLILRTPEPPIRELCCNTAASLGFPAARVIERVERANGLDRTVIGGILSPACYIDQSLPSVLYLAARYETDFESALVANTNVGGDNCHRGAVLGALLGAAGGLDVIPQRWINGLASRRQLEQEIETFVHRFAEGMIASQDQVIEGK